MSFSKTLLVSLGLASLIACGTVSAAEKFGSDRHVARGVSCQITSPAVFLAKCATAPI